jgi:hypothetical protein
MSQNKILNRIQVGYILKRYHIKITGNYEIRADGLLDVNGSINISGSNLFKIPLKFNRVTGDFICKNNSLKSLRGCPQVVGGAFDCSVNNLESLMGGPVHLGGSYNCSENKLLTLKGCAKQVGRDFLCNDNLLQNLVGSPAKIDGYFNCKFNKLTSLEGSAKDFFGRFNCSYNYLTDFSGISERFRGEIYANSNYLKNIKGFKNFDGIIFIDPTASSINTGEERHKNMKIELRLLPKVGYAFMPQPILDNINHIELILKFQPYYDIWSDDGEDELLLDNFTGLIEDILDGLE